jgi:hypothetical protein
LFDRFNRYEAHRRAHGGFINAFGIRRVVLGSFDTATGCGVGCSDKANSRPPPVAPCSRFSSRCSPRRRRLNEGNPIARGCVAGLRIIKERRHKMTESELQLREFEARPRSSSIRLIDFEEAEVRPGIVSGTYILIVRGTKPYLNMEVDLTPLVIFDSQNIGGSR